jgi:surface antigen Omp85-like protein
MLQSNLIAAPVSPHHFLSVLTPCALAPRGAALAVIGVGSAVADLTRPEDLMAVTTMHSAQMLQVVRLVIAMCVVAFPHLCAAQDDRSDDPPDFAPVSQSGGAAGATSATPMVGLFTEPKVISHAISLAVDKFEGQGKNNSGWYLELSNMITGSGWISLGPGYRKYVWNKEAYVDASGAVSWHLYTMAQTRFEAPDLTARHVMLGAQVMWQDQTQINYFGIGPNSPEIQSQYRLRSTDMVGYGSFRPWGPWTLSAEAGYLISPQLSTPSGTFKPSVPPTQEAFPFDPGTQLADQPSYVHGQAAFTGDTRDYRGHPTRGGLYRLSVDTYNDQDTGTFTFRQYQAEALQFVRLGGPNWILALHGWVVNSDVSSDHQVPFYFQPSVGGATSLRSFDSYRYHDLNSALANIESRWAVYPHVDLAVFVDAGNVAPIFDQLNVDHTSVGAGVRFHTQRTSFARVDVAHGSEGWQCVFRTSDFFRFARITRRVADIPFVP